MEYRSRVSEDWKFALSSKSNTPLLLCSNKGEAPITKIGLKISGRGRKAFDGGGERQDKIHVTSCVAVMSGHLWSQELRIREKFLNRLTANLKPCKMSKEPNLKHVQKGYGPRSFG
jgi:hypothetical protein